MKRIKFLSRWRLMLSKITTIPVFDGPLVHCRGITYVHYGWCYAVPVESEYEYKANRLLRLPVCYMLTGDGECVAVIPMEGFVGMVRTGVVYGLMVTKVDREVRNRES